MSNSVPQSASTRESIRATATAQQQLLDEADRGVIDHVIQLLTGHAPSANATAEEAEDSAYNVAQITAFGEEQEQEQEQEEEQEKEQEQQQQKEQEQEVEEPEVFAREKYAREDEYPKTWPLATLAEDPKRQGFYPASEFAVHRSFVDKRGGLHWPESILLSSDHTHPRWRFTSHRRLKNMIVLMEWIPDAAALSMDAAPSATPRAASLSDSQQQRLQRIFEMYDATQARALGEDQIRKVMTDLGLKPQSEARDAAAVDAALAHLRERGEVCVPLPKFQQLMQSQAFLRGERGRYWVALSLREAESLRGALHLSYDAGVALVPGSRAAVGIRIQDVLLDAVSCDSVGGGVDSFPPPPQLQLGSALAAYRFMDCQVSGIGSEQRRGVRQLGIRDVARGPSSGVGFVLWRGV